MKTLKKKTLPRCTTIEKKKQCLNEIFCNAIGLTNGILNSTSQGRKDKLLGLGFIKYKYIDVLIVSSDDFLSFPRILAMKWI